VAHESEIFQIAELSMCVLLNMGGRDERAKEAHKIHEI
jgi:hypothetical protein